MARGALVVALLCGFPACHLILGDYEIAELPAGSGGAAGSAGGETAQGGGVVTCNSLDTYRCSQDRLECSPSGRGFQLVEECASPAHCLAAERRCRVCVEGEKRCEIGTVALRCSLTPGGREVFARESCPAEQVCVEGDCYVCRPTDSYCRGDTLWRCNAELTGWEEIQCPEGCIDTGSQSSCVGAGGVGPG